MNSQFSLLTTRRFLPLFIVQFIGAFIDNLLKSMVAVMVAYGLWETHGVNPAVLVSLAAALFILPFALFCPFAGALSDKYDKALLIRRIKLVEIFIVLAGVFALFSGSLIFALLVLFALGVQSAFFSPNKFSILPQLLSGEELVAGNGLVSTGTYLAILAGTILGSVLALMPGGIEIASSVLIVLALVGYGAARRISCAPPDAASAAMTLRWNVFAQAWGVLKFAFTQTSGVRAAILGTAWFYFVASTFHAQFPNFTKQTLGADNYVLTFFMVVFSLGISVGGLLNHSLLKLRAIGYFIPAACICMGIFGIDLYFAAGSYHAPQGLQTLGQFLGRAQGWRLCLDMFLLAAAGGFFVVPLRAMVQQRVLLDVRARVVSASNMLEAVFMLASALIAGALFSFGMRVEEVYLLVSAMTLGLGLYLKRASVFRE